MFPLEMICMKCQILFSVKKKEEKNPECCLLKFLPSMLSVKNLALKLQIFVLELSDDIFMNIWIFVTKYFWFF